MVGVKRAGGQAGILVDQIDHLLENREVAGDCGTRGGRNIVPAFPSFVVTCGIFVYSRHIEEKRIIKLPKQLTEYIRIKGVDPVLLQIVFVILDEVKQVDEQIDLVVIIAAVPVLNGSRVLRVIEIGIVVIGEA